ncbi:uncharacterized protein LOC124530749 [Vanessa cardui]|uniref:uncharacterized protein LOC124530749 n=1 Tax=Vanessa cardui TaxID=171605 RepID=UPI001F12DB18|nr:uncharacterized protein LOC124530749 [Vanessa cardui]
MDCCNYGEYRGQAHAQYGASPGWEGYGYAPLPYTPYAHAYYSPHAHDPYTRYYRYDYPAHHVHHSDHAMSMDYGAYALKEARTRRALARRELRTHPAHLPLPHTPPLECGINGRGQGYCEPQMWSPYQMGMMGGGWSGINPANGSWASRSMCSREPMRYASDCRLIKGSNMHHQNQICAQDGRSTPYPTYEEPHYNRENGQKQANIQEFPGRNMIPSEAARPTREHFFAEQRRSPPEEKRPPVVPLPAFQQAFGSTEIGKFAEAFSRAEVAHEAEDSTDNFMFESFQDWEASPDPQWTSQTATREIKCEENF